MTPALTFFTGLAIVVLFGWYFAAESDRLRQAGPDPYGDAPEAEEAISLVFDVAIQSHHKTDYGGRLLTSTP